MSLLNEIHLSKQNAKKIGIKNIPRSNYNTTKPTYMAPYSRIIKDSNNNLKENNNSQKNKLPIDYIKLNNINSSKVFLQESKISPLPSKRLKSRKVEPNTTTNKLSNSVQFQKLKIKKNKTTINNKYIYTDPSSKIKRKERQRQNATDFNISITNVNVNSSLNHLIVQNSDKFLLNKDVINSSNNYENMSENNRQVIYKKIIISQKNNKKFSTYINNSKRCRTAINDLDKEKEKEKEQYFRDRILREKINKEKLVMKKIFQTNNYNNNNNNNNNSNNNNNNNNSNNNNLIISQNLLNKKNISPQVKKIIKDNILIYSPKSNNLNNASINYYSNNNNSNNNTLNVDKSYSGSTNRSKKKQAKLNINDRTPSRIISDIFLNSSSSQINNYNISVNMSQSNNNNNKMKHLNGSPIINQDNNYFSFNNNNKDYLFQENENNFNLFQRNNNGNNYNLKINPNPENKPPKRCKTKLDPHIIKVIPIKPYPTATLITNKDIQNYKSNYNNINDNDKNNIQKKKIVDDNLNNLSLPNQIQANISPTGHSKLYDFKKPNTPLTRINNSSSLKKLFPKKIFKRVMKIDSCTVAGFSSPGVQKTNQDNYFIKKEFLGNENQFFLGVCDGHGSQGHLISEYVSKTLPEYVNQITNESISNAYKLTNNEVMSNSKIDSSMSGTTCISILITPEKLICANVGDSRAILARCENGEYKCINLSRDHKPTEPDEMKRIINKGGRIKQFYNEEEKEYIGPERIWLKNSEIPGLAMSRSIGDNLAHTVGVVSEPEIKNINFTGDEKFIVIASDGIWEFVDSEECVQIIKDYYENNMDAAGSLNYLVKETFNRWKNENDNIDDITVIVIFFD